MERCPNCHARWDGAEQCRRCGLELASLLAVERAADQLIRCALMLLGEGNVQASLDRLADARRLYPHPLIEALSGLARAEASLSPGAPGAISKPSSAPSVPAPPPQIGPDSTERPFQSVCAASP